MKRHRSLEEKLAVIKLVEQGQSARSISDKLHLGRHIVYEWLAAYKDREYTKGTVPFVYTKPGKATTESGKQSTGSGREVNKSCIRNSNEQNSINSRLKGSQHYTGKDIIFR